MIIRIVKLSFKAEHVDEFKQNFEAKKNLIRSFDGCQHLELWNDDSNPRQFFTYSHWLSTAHLDAYRHSELFKGVWAKTKVLFDQKPEAWTVNELSRGQSI